MTTATATAPASDARHPVVVRQLERRAADAQLRIADKITAFAGSMAFVYIHAVIFAVWIIAGELVGFDKYPFGLLTLVVSLEAIFLSTFVMIGQNRQAAFAQAKADHDYKHEDQLLSENTELTRTIHRLTEELHKRFIENDQAGA